MIPTPQPPHVTKNTNGVSALVKSNETCRLTGPDGGGLWVQNGHVYDDVGVVIEDIPEWFWEEYNKMTPYMKDRLGLTRGGDLLALEDSDLSGQRAEPENFDFSSKADLQQFARQRGLDFDPRGNKADLIAAIEEDRLKDKVDLTPDT